MRDESECNVLDIRRLYSIFRKAIFPWRWTIVPGKVFSPDARVKISAASAQILTKENYHCPTTAVTTIYRILLIL